MAELEVTFDGRTEVVAIPEEGLVIGRSRECTLPIPDELLSRRHCRIAPAPGGLMLEDLKSKRGTLLAGSPLRRPTPLLAGDLVELGATRLRLIESDSLASGDAHRDARNIRFLLDTLGEVYADTGLDALLRTIVDRAVRLTGAERGALLFADDAGGFECALRRDASGQDLPPDAELTQSLPRRTLETGRAIVVTDGEAPEQVLTSSMKQGGLRSVLCAPLVGPDGAEGVLYVDGRRPVTAFGRADLGVFEALATHGALALERVRLRDSLNRQQQAARRQLEDENERLKSQLGDEPIGESPAMRKALAMLRRLAPSDAIVLLRGETGSGKEVLARTLHRQSPRAKGPFVVVDCGALPESLIESELFGHEKGAFTGASSSRPGRFREADGGTLFLDEIGELPKQLQSRLLRAVQERTVQPVGGSQRVAVDVRIVCATHRDLDEMVRAGDFRQDLFFRIGVITIDIPRLADRGEDVLLLARHFLRRFAALRGPDAPSAWSREAEQAMREHDWPGNVRELQHRMQRAVLLADPPLLRCSDLGLGEAAEAAPAEAEQALPPLQEARATATLRFERGYLRALLTQTRGVVAEAARQAEVSPQLMHRLLKKHGIDRKDFLEA